ncbi:nuclear transport factor 2 family protein [Nocardia gipuzkoensis]
MKGSEVDPYLERAMADSLEAYAAGDNRFFDYLDDDVRVFNLNSTQPMKGRAAFEEAFQPILTQRQISVTESDIQASADRAILSQTLEISSEGASVFVRQTVVWEKKDDAWKMSHIHSALAGQPIVRTDSSTISATEIKVLSERIATVAATVGVAQ